MSELLSPELLLDGYHDGSMSCQLVERFLVERSSLPSPRANLELATRFADAAAERISSSRIRGLLRSWTSIDPDRVSTDDPRVFLVFVALQALGAGSSTLQSADRDDALRVLMHSASDPRWRVREGVAIGFQRAAERDWDSVRRLFTEWLPTAGSLERRAMVASLAHPPILRDPGRAEWAMQIFDRIVSDLESVNAATRGLPDYLVLKKGLSYGISVVTVDAPDAGFRLLRRLAGSDQRDLRRIAATNAGKQRIAKRYAALVAAVLDLVEVRS